MKAKVVVLPKRDFNYELNLLSNDDCYKRFEFSLEKTQKRHDLPPLLSRILCNSPLFVDDLFSVSGCFRQRLCISFSRCSWLDIHLNTYVFFFSLSRSFRLSAYFGVLSNFLTCFSRLPLRLLLLVFLVARSLSSYFQSKLSLYKLEL